MSAFVGILVAIGFLAGLAVLIIKLVKRSTAATNAAWETAARALGATAVPASMMKQHAMSGRVRGFPLDVHQVRIDDTTVTVFLVDFRGAGIEYRLRPESGWTRLGRRFGMADVSVGDAAFDEVVRVKTKMAGRLTVFLTAERRALAAGFLGSHTASTIRDGMVEVRRGGTPDDADEIVATVQAMAAVARVFDVPAANEPEAPDLAEMAEQALAEVLLPDVPALPAPVGDAVEVDDLVGDVFDRDEGLLRSLEQFDDTFAGRRVQWRGEVLRTERAGATGRPGKVVVRVAQMRGEAIGSRDVEAHVFVGTAALPERGADVVLNGTLDRADPLMRRVYVAAGTVV